LKKALREKKTHLYSDNQNWKNGEGDPLHSLHGSDYSIVRTRGKVNTGEKGGVVSIIFSQKRREKKKKGRSLSYIFPLPPFGTKGGSGEKIVGKVEEDDLISRREEERPKREERGEKETKGERKVEQGKGGEKVFSSRHPLPKKKKNTKPKKEKRNKVISLNNHTYYYLK